MGERVEFETYHPLGSWERSRLESKQPSCLNGYVQVIRYRIVCEPIEEPAEVVHARLQKLWDESTNHHDHTPLTAWAKKLGYTLQGSRGSKAVRR